MVPALLREEDLVREGPRGIIAWCPFVDGSSRNVLSFLLLYFFCLCCS